LSGKKECSRVSSRSRIAQWRLDLAAGEAEAGEGRKEEEERGVTGEETTCVDGEGGGESGE